MKSILAIVLCVLMINVISCEKKKAAADGQIQKKMIGTWKSVNISVEDGVTYKTVEVLTLETDRSYSGMSETFKDDDKISMEKFSGSYKVINNVMHWIPDDDDNWKDEVAFMGDSLTFIDTDGDSNSYGKLK